MPSPRQVDEAAEAIRQLRTPRLTLLPLDRPARIPDVPQEPILRYETNRSPSDVQAGFPNRRRTILADVNRGLEQGANEWYHAEPVRQAFIAELGEAEGTRQYNLFADMVAGSSSISDVRKNVQKASWYRQQALEGRLPAGMDSQDEAVDWLSSLPGGRPPQGYGSTGSRNDALWTSRFLDGDQTWRAAEPGAAHKILSFDQNLRGNLTPWTGDRHEAMRLGVPQRWNSKTQTWEKGALTPNEYVAAEQMMARMADRLGLEPAELQSARWMGGAKATGVESTDPTFAHAVEAVVNQRASKIGETPEWVLRNFVRNGGLLAIPAAVATDDLIGRLEQ